MTCAPIIVMGVSGCGKTTVGAALATALDMRFVDGDTLHPPANIQKMSQGDALTDADRWPWLDAVGDAIKGRPKVIACSALKHAYRDRIRVRAGGPVHFVYLHGTRDLLKARMQARAGHFMPAHLLDSQLDTLETPTDEIDAITVSIDASVNVIVAHARAKLRTVEVG